MTMPETPTPRFEPDNDEAHIRHLADLIATSDAFVLVTIQPEDEFGQCEVTEDGGGASRISTEGLRTLVRSTGNLLGAMSLKIGGAKSWSYPWEREG